MKRNNLSKMYKLMVSVVILLTLNTIYSCSQNTKGGFKENENGLMYKFFTRDKEANKAEIGDMVDLSMYYMIEDSVIFDTRKNPNPFKLQIIESNYPGDIYEAITMMAVGDSAAFQISADSFFMKSVGLQQLPEFIKAGSVLEFHIKMTALQTKVEFEAEQQKLREEQEKMLAEKKAQEEQDLKNYLEQNKINTAPRESGLIYIETQKGTGKKAVSGSKVKVHYTGTLLDGTKFDSSYDRDTPLEFQLGAGKVIKGWDEGISLMNVGGKAKLIIPSAIGYGERGAGNVIPPYAPLVFEVELIGVE